MKIESMLDIDEMEDDDPISEVSGTIVALYAPKDGKYPRQYGKIADDEGNEAWFCLANESKFLDRDEWRDEYVTFKSQKVKSGAYKGKETGVKIKGGDKGNSIWVTNTAILYDESGDEIETGNGSSNRSNDRSDRSPRRREKPERSRSKSKGGDQQLNDGIHVNELLTQLTEVTIAAFNIYESKGCDSDIAATLASGTASAVAHWWFGSKAPAGIQDLVSDDKPTKKTNRKRKARTEDLDEEYDEDEDEIPFQ